MRDGWSEVEIGRSRRGAPLRAFLPAARPIYGLLLAGMHGEEPETVLIARRLLERVAGAEARFALLPCVNPDGIVDGIRQNAAGVDVNRNFPAASWSPEASFTFPPGCTDRRKANRTNRSSSGAQPASEPETVAVLGLIETLAPSLIVDLHAPLALVLRSAYAPGDVVDALATAAGLPVHDDLGSPTPGALRDWCTDRALPTIVYEVEHAGLPALLERHLPGLEALVRAP